MNLETIVFENKSLRIIDQTQLPYNLEYIELPALKDVISAIKELKVRGAPAIGVTAAWGFYAHAINLHKTNSLNLDNLNVAARELISSRPTAVNLKWAVDKMLAAGKKHIDDSKVLLEKLEHEAVKIHESDRETCRQIGEHGSTIVPAAAEILTHCNAGSLATGGMGTALSVIYKSAEQNKKVHVFADETRPLGQGARITYWELQRNDIPVTLICDSMAASLMQQKKIDLVVVGADRIAGNGDAANKIGTYSLAVLADFHGIPFYVAAPISTIDFSLANGSQIPIEHRHPEEILDFWKIPKDADYDVFNPAFDLTPHELITGIITEKGIITKPINTNLNNLII